MTNYPPGVTGNEYEIAGPDFEEDSDTPCPHVNRWEENGIPVELECGVPTMEQGYRGKHWLVCDDNHITDLPPVDPHDDDDRAYDAMIDKQMGG